LASGVTSVAVSALAVNGPTAVVDLMGNESNDRRPTSSNILPGQGGTIRSTPITAPQRRFLTSTAGGIFAGNITGNLAFTRSGTSITLFTGANGYTGDTTVRGGVLAIARFGLDPQLDQRPLQYGTLTIDQSGLNPNTVDA